MDIVKKDTLKTSIPKGSLVKNYNDLLVFVKQNADKIYHSDDGQTVDDVIELNFFQDESIKGGVKQKTLFNSQVKLKNYQQVESMNDNIKNEMEKIQKVQQLYNKGLFFNYILQSKSFVNLRYNKLDIKQMFIKSQEVLSGKWKTFYEDRIKSKNSANKKEYHDLYPILFISNLLQQYHGEGDSFVEFSLGALKLNDDQVGFRVSFQSLYLYNKIQENKNSIPIYGKILFLPQHKTDKPNPPWGWDYSIFDEKIIKEPINIYNVGNLTGLFGWTNDKPGEVNTIQVDVILPKQGFGVYNQDNELSQVIIYQKMKEINISPRLRLQFDVDHHVVGMFRLLKIEAIKKGETKRSDGENIVYMIDDRNVYDLRQGVDIIDTRLMLSTIQTRQSQQSIQMANVGNYIQIERR